LPSEIIETNDDGIISHSSYFYDSQNRLNRIHLVKENTNGMQNTDDIIEYSYDGNVITEKNTIVASNTMYHLNAEPSEVAAPEHYPWDHISANSREYSIMGFLGKCRNICLPL
jgi:hypothetical protein